MKYETLLRLSSFFVIFLLFASIETIFPFRRPAKKRLYHYLFNLSLIAMSWIVIGIVFPLVAVSTATIAYNNQWGLFGLLALPEATHILATIIAFDCIVYFQHRLFHLLPWLWRLHRLHHADQDYDSSTGIRFHPVEIMISMLIKMSMAIALGAHPVGILIFEILLNSASLFSHMNVALPESIDRVLRHFLVTPTMHRVHHSPSEQFTNSNFSFNLSIWDHIFSTYREVPIAEQRTMPIGVKSVD